MSSGHYSLQDSHFFWNSSSSEWVLVRGMTATWVALIARSRIILNQQYIPCSLYQMCLVRDSEHDEEGDSSPMSTSTGTGTNTGREGSESSGTWVMDPDVHLNVDLTGPGDGDVKGCGVSTYLMR